MGTHMQKYTKCPTCGTPLNEVPLFNCVTHKAYKDGLPTMTQEEILESLECELPEIIHGRTGDD